MQSKLRENCVPLNLRASRFKCLISMGEWGTTWLGFESWHSRFLEFIQYTRLINGIYFFACEDAMC